LGPGFREKQASGFRYPVPGFRGAVMSLVVVVKRSKEQGLRRKERRGDKKQVSGTRIPVSGGRGNVIGK